jgi:hypothetical protein
MAPQEITVGEELEIRLDLVNVSKKPATLIKVEGIIYPEFSFSKKPSFFFC